MRATPLPSAARPAVRALIALHGALVGTLLLAGLALDAPAHGWVVLAVVTGYLALLVPTARRAGGRELAGLAGFLIAVSAVQLLPDWVLADLVGTLRFPDTGGLRVGGAIPLAMAGLWVAPLLAVVVVARGSAVRGALAALAVFGVAELLAPALQLWEPTGAAEQVAGVALYVLPAEAALGAATVLAWTAVRGRSRGVQLWAALAIGTLYLGALVLAHFLVDRASFTVG